MSPPNEPPNEPPPEREPDPVAAVDPLDERLSAALDGHEGTAPEPDARAAERGRDLAAARDLLALPPPPLDDITRRRLLRTALDASPTSSRPTSERMMRRMRGGAVAAAVIAVIALAGWGLASLNQNSSQKASSGKSGASATTGAPGPVDLHDVSNPSVLKRRVQAALGSSAPERAPTPTALSQPDLAETTVPRANTGAPQCLSSVKVPAGDTPEFLGTATFHDAPALVFVAREPSRTLIFVLESSDCRLLSFQFLKR
jgi:hypothetical protein